MGNRTLVLLYNDHAHEWEKDPELGRKIMLGMNYVNDPDKHRASLGNFGKVVECTHADTNTLAVVESYNFHPVAHGGWYRDQTSEARDLELLKRFADKMGYRLTKKPAPTPMLVKGAGVYHGKG